MRVAAAVAVLALGGAVGAGAQAPPDQGGDFEWDPSTLPWTEEASWNAPIASFTADPPYETGRDIALHSTSTHPSGSSHIASYEWDLDGDGAYDDATGPNTTVRYATPGEREVGLRVTDDQGAWSAARMPLNFSQGTGSDPQPGGPTASFTVKGTRQVGKTLKFTSTSTGTITTYAWDLDGDGAYDDGTAATAKMKYSTPGNRVVALRVTDDQGRSNVAQQTITVARKPSKKPKKSGKK
jgi:PKD repeat protein